MFSRMALRSGQPGAVSSKGSFTRAPQHRIEISDYGVQSEVVHPALKCSDHRIAYEVILSLQGVRPCRVKNIEAFQARVCNPRSARLRVSAPCYFSFLSLFYDVWSSMFFSPSSDSVRVVSMPFPAFLLWQSLNHIHLLSRKQGNYEVYHRFFLGFAPC